ncbi:MAG TPA: hypothetical protein VHH88_09235, partial [Verrucomicrobiae bacterium]|nr:hypothetical protein [Verrucomicrobiae bacterium]
MIKAATITLGLVMLIAAPAARSQSPAPQTAIEEGIRRQAARISLRQTLENARAAEARHDLPTAARLYSDAWNLVLQIGPNGIPEEIAATKAGTARTRMELAQIAQKRGDLRGADTNVREVLRTDPTNAEAIAFKKNNDKLLAQQFPKMPTPEVAARVPVITAERATNSTHIQDGKLLYEMGKYDEAEATLLQALREDPQNQAARYYLNLITDARYRIAAADKDNATRNMLKDVEKEWLTTETRSSLPSPNLYARTNLVFTSSGRQRISSK